MLTPNRSLADNVRLLLCDQTSSLLLPLIWQHDKRFQDQEGGGPSHGRFRGPLLRVSLLRNRNCQCDEASNDPYLAYSSSKCNSSVRFRDECRQCK